VGADALGALDGGPAGNSHAGSNDIPAEGLGAQGAQDEVALVGPHELVSHDDISGGFGAEDRHNG
jgi:hypothetical protein